MNLVYIGTVKQQTRKELHRYELLAFEMGITINKLAVETGVGVSTIRMAIERKSPVSIEIAEKILTRWPNVNSEWLITGKGNILKNIASPSGVGEADVPYNTKKGLTDFVSNTLRTWKDIFKGQDLSAEDHILMGNILKLLEERNEKKKQDGKK